MMAFVDCLVIDVKTEEEKKLPLYTIISNRRVRYKQHNRIHGAIKNSSSGPVSLNTL